MKPGKDSYRQLLFHFLLGVLLTTITRAQVPEHTRLIYQSPLTSDSYTDFATQLNHNGKYLPDGWQATTPGVETGSKIIVSFSDRLPAQGTIEWKIRNFDPYNQTNYAKQHVAMLTSREGGTWEVYQTLGSWAYIRTGVNYRGADGSCSMKLDVGADSSKRQEKQMLPGQIWNKNHTYTFKIVYDHSFFWLFIDNELVIKVDFPGQVHRFKYLYLNGDGEYPSMVGAIYSELKVYTSQTDMFFQDKTYTLNLMGLGAPDFAGHGITLGDINNDGLTDIYLGNCYQEKCLRDILYIQQPDGTFADETNDRGVIDECCSHGVIFFDADNDGDLDLFNANTWEPNQLYINDGTGYFTEESYDRGIENINSETRGAVVLDVNNDGYLDIYAVNWGMQNEMYINDGTGHFTREYRGAEGAVEDKEAVGTQGVTVADLDNDGDYDIYVCKREKANELYLNTNGYFTEVALARGVGVGGRSDGATFADYDNDGDMDLFVANTKQPKNNDPLYLGVFENNGSGYFTDRTNDYHLVMDGFTIQLADVDNDGDLDLYRLRNNDFDDSAMPILSLNNGNGQFVSAGYCGADVIGGDARGCVFHDFDRDGDLDLYITAKLFDNIFLKNQSVLPNNWIEIATVGPQGDLGGVGSKIDLYEAGCLGDPARLLGHREVTTVVGYLSGAGLVQHFGLGSHTQCDVRITLVDGSVVEKQNITANQHIDIRPDTATFHLIYISGNGQTGFINQPLDEPFVVKVLNQNNEPGAGVAVEFVNLQGNGSFTGNAIVFSDAAGIASINYILGSSTGVNTVEARLDTSKVQFSAIGKTPTVTLRKLGGDNQVGAVAQPLANPVEVKVVYPDGQAVVNYPITFSIVQGGGNLGGLLSRVIYTDDAGIARAQWTMGASRGLQRLTATSTDARVEFNATAIAGPANSMIKISGDGQPIQPGIEFSGPFVVRIIDSYNNPVQNQPVDFQVTQGGGHLRGFNIITVTSDSSGLARAYWTPGTSPGLQQELQAKSSHQGQNLIGSPVTWTYAGGTLPDPVKSTITGTSPVVANGQDRAEIVVTLKDNANVPKAGYTVRLSVSGAGNVLSVGDSLSNQNGQVRAFLSSTIAGTKTVSAKVVDTNMMLASNATVVFTSPHYPADTILYISGNHQVGTVGTALAKPFVIQVQDEQRQPVQDYEVEFSVLQGNGSLAGRTNYRIDTDPNGFASVTLTLGLEAGRNNNVVSATVAGAENSPVNFVASAMAGAAAHLIKVTGDNQTGIIGQLLPGLFGVAITDVYGNDIGGYPVQFKVLEGMGSFGNSDIIEVRTDSAGNAWASLTLGKIPGQNRVEARTAFAVVTFTATGELGPVDITRSKIVATSPVKADGEAQSKITVTLVNAYDNPIPGVNIILAATGSDNNWLQPGATNEQGKTIGYLSSSIAETKIITATILPATIHLLDNASVIFSNDNIETLVRAGDWQNGTVGQVLSVPLKVQLLILSNPVGDYPIQFWVTRGNGHFYGQRQFSTRTDSGGYAFANFTLGTIAGLNKVMATAVGADSAIFTANGVPDVPARLIKVSGDSQFVVIGQPLAQELIVQVLDSHDNICPDAPVTFLALNGGQVLIPQQVLSDSSGLAHCRVAAGLLPGKYIFQAQLNNGYDVTFSATAREHTVNHPPEIRAISDTTIYQNQNLEFVVSATDLDGDPVVLTVKNLPEGAEFNGSPVGIFRWTPTSSQIGHYNVLFTACDSPGDSTIAMVGIKVINVNRPPRIISCLPQQQMLSVHLGELINFSITAFDPDAEPMHYIWQVNDWWFRDSDSTFQLITNVSLPLNFTVTGMVHDLRDTTKVTWQLDVQTGIELISFTAQPQKNGGIQVCWETGTEANNAGFNLWRCQSENGSYELLNAELIQPMINGMGHYVFKDMNVSAGQRYFYKLEDLSVDGWSILHGPVSVATAVPDAIRLCQNFPNPFNPTTFIAFELPKKMLVKLRIFNQAGQIVTTLVNSEMPAGFHGVTWNGLDGNGDLVPSGIYYYRLEAPGYSAMKKLMMIK